MTIPPGLFILQSHFCLLFVLYLLDGFALLSSSVYKDYYIGPTGKIQNNFPILHSLILITSAKSLLPSKATYSQVLNIRAWGLSGEQLFWYYYICICTCIHTCMYISVYITCAVCWCLVAQLCLTLCNPMGCSLSASPVHVGLQCLPPGYLPNAGIKPRSLAL